MDCTAADVRRRVMALSGTPDELAARLRTLMESAGANGKSGRRGEEVEFMVEVAALRRVLTERFAERHGWRHTKRSFSPKALANRRVSGGVPWMERWHRSITDHPYFFRTAGGQAAATVAHIYPFPGHREEAEAWAEWVGLRVQFPRDCASWWYPGHTELCVYTPAAECPAVAGPSWRATHAGRLRPTFR